MPKKASTKTSTPMVLKNQPKRKNNNNRRKPQQRLPVVPNRLRNLISMINHPCSGPMEPGLFGTSEGIMQRFVTNFTPVSSSGYGYAIWFPSLHTGVAGGDYTLNPKPVSSFIWNDTGTGDTVPLNTLAAPFGSGGAGTASSLRDPFFTTAASNNVQDGRTLAACIRIRPTNAISSIQGTISFLDNIPANLFDLNTAGGVNAPPTVNQMLAYSRKIERLGIETYEVKHRPSESDRFFTDPDGVANFNQGTFVTGTTPIGDSVSPRGIGFVWTNASAASSFLISLYKVVEWRPSPLAGVPVPRPLSYPGTPTIPNILSKLDSLGEWMHSVGSHPATSNIIEAAWTGGRQLLYRSTNKSQRLN